MILTAKSLENPTIRHAFFTRQGGVSSGIYESLNGGLGSKDSRTHVLENRARMAAHFGFNPAQILSCYQVHSPTVITATEPWAHEDNPQADALVTREKGLALAIATADCGPILFADLKNGVIGAAHAGWKGAKGGVLESTLAAMEKLGATRTSIHVALGPMIQQQSYEVGAEFEQNFIEDDNGNQQFFARGTKPDHPLFDLPAYITHRLSQAGITTIENLARDTYTEETLFYSHRRSVHKNEGDYGRLISAIALV